MQPYPCLWFTDQAEPAARFYVSIFKKKSRIIDISRYGDACSKVSGCLKGTVMTVTFELNGQQFMGLNGGPHYKISPAVSFVVECKTQKEIDYFWNHLSAGGQEVQCGWLTDQFGVSWQIVPAELGKWMKNPRKSERVMEALLGMVKLDLAELRRAYRLA